MFDNCMILIIFGIFVLFLLYLKNKKTNNNNCMILIFIGIFIVGLMLLDNTNNNDYFKNVEKFNPNNLNSIEKSNKNELSDFKQDMYNQQTLNQQTLNQQTLNQQLDNIPTGNTTNDNNFNLNNDNFTLNVNSNDTKYTNNNETKQALQAKDLLPGFVLDSKDKFDTFTDLFNYDKALELDIAENKLGIDTIGQSKRNASQDLREVPICPKFNIGPWNNSTIEPDNNIKSLY